MNPTHYEFTDIQMNERPRITLIAAIARNGIIGHNNRLPWHLPADLKRFKRETMGKPIVMGRKTWESLPGLLPHRTHIVVTRDQKYVAEGAFVAHSLEEALAFAGGDDVSIIGGAQLYRAALPLADRMLITEVDVSAEGNIMFPEYDRLLWQEVSREAHMPDQSNPYPYSFVTLERRNYRNLGVVSDEAPDTSTIA